MSYMTLHPILSKFPYKRKYMSFGSNPQSFETAMNKQVHVHCMESIEEEVVCPPVEFRKQLLLTEASEI